MHGQYQPYGPPPPGYPPPRRDKANLVPLFIAIGTVVVLLLGGLTFVLVRATGGDGDDGGSEGDLFGPGSSPTYSASPSPEYDGRAITADYAGTWSGTGFYTNASGNKRSFTARITLFSGLQTGSSFYTGFLCSGRLQVESITPTKLVVTETITVGAQKGGGCEDAPTGFLVLERSGDSTMQYQWFGSRTKMESGRESSSVATLSRVTQSGTGT